MSRLVRHDWFLSRVHPGRRQATNRRATASSFPFHRRLRIEPLEDRRLLAVVTVNTLDDTVDFNDGVTSLREAIFATNLVGGADTIEFAASLTSGGPATIMLTQGELAITDSLDDQRPGREPAHDRRHADATTATTACSTSTTATRNAHKTVSISGLTLTGGDVQLRRTGLAAISQSGKPDRHRQHDQRQLGDVTAAALRATRRNLTVTDSTISGNSAHTAAAAAFPASRQSDSHQQHDQRQLGQHGGGGICSFERQPDGHQQHDQRQLGQR